MVVGGVGEGGTNLPPALETFVNFRNFAELHLRSFKTHHFQTWQFYWYKTTARLAQLDKRQSSEREAAGSSPGRTNTQGL